MRERTSLEHKRALHRIATAKYRLKNPNVGKILATKFRTEHPVRYLLTSAKSRAKENGLEFSVTEEDLLPSPTHCSVLGLELIYGGGTKGRPHHRSASLDRFDNSLGYTKDNTKIISWRANELKKDGTLEEFKALLKYLENGK